MKYINSILAVGFVAIVAYSAQDTTLTQREVRDPLQLEAWLEANASDVESRLDDVESATALSVTNGQAVTASASTYILSGIGGANDTTNTITLAAPSAAGKSLTLIVATTSSNLIQIADSGTVAASGAILLDGNDTAVLKSVDTNTWCLISESDN